MILKRLLLTVTALLIFTAPSLQAESLQGTVGVVHVARIAQESKAGKSMASQVQSLNTELKELIEKEEKDLKNAEEQLQRQRTIVSPEVYQQKRQDFQKEVAGLQQKIRVKSRETELGLRKAEQELKQAISKIIGDIAQQQNLELVLPREQILYGTGNLDITNAVISQLDRTVSKVKVSPVALKQ